MSFQNKAMGCTLTNGRDSEMGISRNLGRVGQEGELKESNIGHRLSSEVEEQGV
jgi:hypothetical protein